MPSAAVHIAVSPRRVGVVVASALVVALVLPVLWSVLRRPDVSSGDVALIELRVRALLAGDPGLVGAHSRFGWSHPGPLLFFVFALPYRVFGGDSDGLRLTALLVNALVIALTVWLASRRGRAAVGWAAIAIVGVVRARMPGRWPTAGTSRSPCCRWS